MARTKKVVKEGKVETPKETPGKFKIFAYDLTITHEVAAEIVKDIAHALCNLTEVAKMLIIKDEVQEDGKIVTKSWHFGPREGSRGDDPSGR